MSQGCLGLETEETKAGVGEALLEHTHVISIIIPLPQMRSPKQRDQVILLKSWLG